jgi:hypothetical protein
MDLELTPQQPPAVEIALAEALAEPIAPPDPWWQAGLEDALET